VEGPVRVTNGAQIGNEVAAVPGRQAETVGAIEMLDHLVEGLVAAVMEIRRVEIRIEQGRRLEEAARADVMLDMINEGARRLMATGTAQSRIVRKWLCKQRLAAALRVGCGVDEASACAELEVGQEIDLHDIGRERVEQRGRWLRPGKFVDDDIAHEVA